MFAAAQREVGDCVAAAWAERAPAMEPLVRMLLAADRYAAAGLRAECLRRLAPRFDRVELGSEEGRRPGAPDLPRQRRAPRLPLHDRRVFEAFLVAVAPTVWPKNVCLNPRCMIAAFWRVPCLLGRAWWGCSGGH